MASYVTPKKNTAFIMYTALVSQADTKLLKSGPTLAAGDFKVSIDGGAFANLATLPTNTPSGVALKISLSSGEMNGDNILIACIDAAGAEWCDQAINIQTSARQIDDLTFPATSGRSLVVDANGLADANAVKLGPSGSGQAITAAAGVTFPSSVASPTNITAGTITTATNLTTNNDKTGYGLSAAAVQAIWDALTSVLTTVGSIGKLIVTNLDALISSRSTYAGGAVASVTGAVGSVTAAVTVGTNSDKTGYALTAGEHTNVVADVNSAINAGETELASVPTTISSLRSKINFLFEYIRNKRTVTATTELLLKEDAITTLGTATLSDDGTTFTKGEMN